MSRSVRGPVLFIKKQTNNVQYEYTSEYIRISIPDESVLEVSGPYTCPVSLFSLLCRERQFLRVRPCVHYVPIYIYSNII